MKRDMELVRSILIKLSEHEHGFAPDDFLIPEYTNEQIGYHCFLLDQAGLIRAADATTMDEPSPIAIPLNLTWQGHEFIENAKNDKVWGQAKQAVSKIGDVSFSVWAGVLTEVVKQNLGLGS